MEKDETRAKLEKEFLEQHVPKYYPKFEKIIQTSEGNFLLSKDYTWADLHIAHTLQFLNDALGQNLMAGYPGLSKFCESVFNIPGVKVWIQNRPKTTL